MADVYNNAFPRSVGGGGAHEIAFTVQVAGTTIPNADVVITEVDSAIDENLIDARAADANGLVTFPGLDAGTYWCHLQKAGVSPSAALVLTIDSAGAFAFSSVS